MNKNLWWDNLSEKTGEKYLKKIQSEPVIVGETNPDDLREEFSQPQNTKNLIYHKTQMGLR